MYLFKQKTEDEIRQTAKEMLEHLQKVVKTNNLQEVNLKTKRNPLDKLCSEKTEINFDEKRTDISERLKELSEKLKNGK